MPARRKFSCTEPGKRPSSGPNSGSTQNVVSGTRAYFHSKGRHPVNCQQSLDKSKSTGRSY